MYSSLSPTFGDLYALCIKTEQLSWELLLVDKARAGSVLFKFCYKGKRNLIIVVEVNYKKPKEQRLLIKLRGHWALRVIPAGCLVENFQLYEFSRTDIKHFKVSLYFWKFQTLR